MSNRIEKTYGGAVRGIFIAVNPLKKKFLKTYCTVHKFIVIQALEILKNDDVILNDEIDRIKNSLTSGK